MTRVHRLISLSLLTAGAAVLGCGDAGRDSARAANGATEELPRWSFSEDLIFPADRPLMRPEDGVALPDGRLLVADQAHGLRLILEDGSTRPFGRFAEAGYVHRPPDRAGGANGVSLEPAGTHVLVTDVHHGGIYRVDVVSEDTEVLYRHAFGVNSARRDRRGGVWFSQSTRNTPENAEAEIWRAIASPVADGALYYLPGAGGTAGIAAVRVADSLYFANGLALDEQAGHLYVAELMRNRVLRFRMDVAAGRLTDRATALEVLTPDNLELDSAGLWIVSALRSEILVLDLDSGVARPVFRIATPRSEELIREAEARLQAGTSALDLLGPDLWEPGPGSMTGVVLSPSRGPVYVTNLGNALIRLGRDD
jgi:sugar lactone lactonase YvrE